MIPVVIGIICGFCLCLLFETLYMVIRDIRNDKRSSFNESISREIKLCEETIELMEEIKILKARLENEISD